MAPNLIGSSSFLLADVSSAEPVQILSKPDVQLSHPSLHQKPVRRVVTSDEPKYHWQIVWRNVFLFILLHSFGVYGLWILLTKAKWSTILFCKYGFYGDS